MLQEVDIKISSKWKAQGMYDLSQTISSLCDKNEHYTRTHKGEWALALKAYQTHGNSQSRPHSTEGHHQTKIWTLTQANGTFHIKHIFQAIKHKSKPCRRQTYGTIRGVRIMKCSNMCCCCGNDGTIPVQNSVGENIVEIFSTLILFWALCSATWKPPW